MLGLLIKSLNIIKLSSILYFFFPLRSGCSVFGRAVKIKPLCQGYTVNHTQGLWQFERKKGLYNTKDSLANQQEKITERNTPQCQ